MQDDPYRYMYFKIQNGEYSSDFVGMIKFRDDLQEAYGTTDHPKAKDIFELAYRKGPASSYGGILIEYADLVSLVR